MSTGNQYPQYIREAYESGVDEQGFPTTGFRDVLNPQWQAWESNNAQVAPAPVPSSEPVVSVAPATSTTSTAANPYSQYITETYPLHGITDEQGFELYNTREILNPQWQNWNTYGTPDAPTPPAPPAPAYAGPDLSSRYNNPWAIDAAAFHKAVDPMLGGNTYWSSPEGQKGNIYLPLLGGKTWTPSGASSGITYHPAGETTGGKEYDGEGNLINDSPVVTNPYAYYDISGDLSEILGRPGSNVHANVKYVEQNGRLIPVADPATWNWTNSGSLGGLLHDIGPLGLLAAAAILGPEVLGLGAGDAAAVGASDLFGTGFEAAGLDAAAVDAAAGLSAADLFGTGLETAATDLGTAAGTSGLTASGGAGALGTGTFDTVGDLLSTVSAPTVGQGAELGSNFLTGASSGAGATGSLGGVTDATGALVGSGNIAASGVAGLLGMDAGTAANAVNTGAINAGTNLVRTGDVGSAINAGIVGALTGGAGSLAADEIANILPSDLNSTTGGALSNIASGAVSGGTNAALTGRDIGQGILGGAASGATNAITSDIGSAAKSLASPLSTIDPALAAAASGAITGGVVGGLTGQDPLQSALTAGATGGVKAAVGELANTQDWFKTLSPNQQSLAVNAMTSALAGKPLDTIALNTAIAAGRQAITGSGATTPSTPATPSTDTTAAAMDSMGNALAEDQNALNDYLNNASAMGSMGDALAADQSAVNEILYPSESTPEPYTPPEDYVPTTDFTSTPVDYSLPTGLTNRGDGLSVPEIQPESSADYSTPIDYSLSTDTSTLPEMGGGQGLVAPDYTSLPSMGGGQGLTVDTGTGYVNEAGYTPYVHDTTLGDPMSFINNPDVTGLPSLPAAPVETTTTDTTPAVTSTPTPSVTPTVIPTVKTPTQTGGLPTTSTPNNPFDFKWLDTTPQMLKAAPTNVSPAHMAALHQLYQSLTPELKSLFADQGIQAPQETEGYASGGTTTDTAQSVMESLTPKFSKSPTFLEAAPVIQQPSRLTALKHFYSGLTGRQQAGGLAHGGLPQKYAEAAPDGHKPQFITGLTGYYATGDGTGQSDDIPAMLHDGDYVVDADVVAALGDGSSKAGAQALSKFQSQVPHKDGGPIHGHPVPAKIADGEYVLPAAFVTALGSGDNKAGAKLLDEMRLELREHKRSASINKIPPKAKSPLDYLKMAKG